MSVQPPGPRPPQVPRPGFPPPGAPLGAAAPWRPVRGGMLLVAMGLLVVASISMLHGLLQTALIQQLRSGSTEPGVVFDRLNLFAKVFTLFDSAGLALVLVGALGVARAPRPGSTTPLAVLAMVGCGVLLVTSAGEWMIRLIDDQAAVLRYLDTKPAFVVSAVASALLTGLLPLALESAMRRAGRPGMAPLTAICVVLAGLVLSWYCYLVFAAPHWRLPADHPWLWLLLRHAPGTIRTSLTAVLALVGVAQLRAAVVGQPARA